MAHVKARCDVYPGSKDVKRFPVPDEKVPWSVEWPEYKPVDYTADVVAKQPAWADQEIRSLAKGEPMPAWNCVDGKIDRKSLEGNYDIVDGVPRNPTGRTGLVGRGLLGRWGPNHAADPIITRWKRTQSGEIEQRDGRKVLEFVTIKRKDNGRWAIPGGMVEAGDTVSATLKKEFGEEALNSLEASEEEKKKMEEQISKLFHKEGSKVYEGYVDDPRNTDSSWMETVAMNFHDSTGEACGRVHLCAGDDAGEVCWREISQKLELYASHLDFIRKVAELHNAAF